MAACLGAASVRPMAKSALGRQPHILLELVVIVAVVAVVVNLAFNNYLGAIDGQSSVSAA